jgi:uncharacterized protein YcfJ
MVTVIRSTLFAALLVLGAALPAVAQQATGQGASDQPATPPTVAQPAEPAAPAEGTTAADMDAMVQKLKRDLQALTDAARDGAQNVLNRQSPYVVTTEQLAAIAAGAVAGAIVIDFMGGGGLATLTGAAVGGVIGNWVYSTPKTAPVPATPVPQGG